MTRSTANSISDTAYLQNQLELARREISNLRQQLISLNHVYKKEISSVNKKLEQWECMKCRTRQIDEEAACSASNNSENEREISCKYIGTIRTNFPEKRGTPRQPGVCSDSVAKLTLDNTVFTNPNHSLEGLQEFSHMWILFHFHKNDSTHLRAKVAPPRLNGIRTGVFATRSPHRPCPIGLSLVKIDRITESTIYFSGVDMVDQTPVLDIKPYIPQYDNPELSHLYYPEEILLGNRDGLTSTRSSDSVATIMNNTDEILENSTREGPEIVNVRVMDGEENQQRHILGAAPNLNLPRAEEAFYGRTNSRMGEREAPDGEEEDSGGNNQPATVTGAVGGQIRVPSWIDQPPVPRLEVSFKDRAVAQLSQLGSEGEEKKNTITNVLKEDPRSVYLRERWGSHCYVFRIAELYVSCKFNDNTHTVTVYQVFQNDERQLETVD